MAAATECVAAKRRAVEGDDGGAPAAKRQKPAGTSVIAPVEASSSAMGGGAMGGGSIPYSDGELEAEVDMVLALLFALVSMNLSPPCGKFWCIQLYS